jgi:GT2 family glycosyltransferase
MVLGMAKHFRGPITDRELDYIVGASMLIRTTALRGVGELDERFFLYWEDVDLCFRLRAAGWKLAVAPASRVLHEDGGTIGRGTPVRDEWFSDSAVRFFRLHASLSFIPILAGSSGRFLRHLALARWDRAGAVVRGTRRGLAAGDGPASSGPIPPGPEGDDGTRRPSARHASRE